jgi:hypothetical protein
MFQRFRLAVLAVGLLWVSGQASQADVIFQFTQVGPTLENPFPGSGPPFPSPILADMHFVVTDDAFASGMNFRQRNGDIAAPFAYLDGLVGLHVSLSNLLQAISASLPDFTKPIPIRGTGFSHIEITSAPGGLPVGSVLYSSPQDMTVEFLFNGTNSVSGRAIGDGSCFWGCSFNGVLTTAVPEPAAILTFGIALLGLAAACRRRAK